MATSVIKPRAKFLFAHRETAAFPKMAATTPMSGPAISHSTSCLVFTIHLQALLRPLTAESRQTATHFRSAPDGRLPGAPPEFIEFWNRVRNFRPRTCWHYKLIFIPKESASLRSALYMELTTPRIPP